MNDQTAVDAACKMCNNASQTDGQEMLPKQRSKPMALAEETQAHLPDTIPFVDSLPGLNVGQSIPETAAAGVSIPVQSAAAGL